jgi:putative hydrolase
MDRAFDGEYADLRRKLEQRRQGRGPIEWLVRRLLGLSVKRRQYERGKEFFDAVVDRRGMETAGRVWEAPELLPTDAELDDPSAWIARIDQ